jgi:hypothetical protein
VPYLEIDEVVVYVAPDRILRQGDSVQVLAKWVYKKPQRASDGRVYN